MLVHSIMRTAFAEFQGTLQPDSGANRETVEDVQAAMREGGAVLAWDGPEAIGSARYVIHLDHLYVERVAVLPSHRRRGIASKLMACMEERARELGRPRIRVGVRMSLTGNVDLYRSLGYATIEVVPHQRGPDRIASMVKELDGSA